VTASPFFAVFLTSTRSFTPSGLSAVKKELGIEEETVIVPKVSVSSLLHPTREMTNNAKSNSFM
jgi:hypothetical protein